MTKVAINAQHGGFGLSEAAFEKLLNRKGIAFETCIGRFNVRHYYHAGHLNEDKFYLSPYNFYDDRADADLIAVIEEMGDEAQGKYASLKILEIPDDVSWHIAEYDGLEWVAEDHRKWY